MLLLVMGTCIPTHALLSALLRQVEQEAKVPSDADLSALLSLGIPADEVARALRRIDSPAAQEAEALLGRLTRTA